MKTKLRIDKSYVLLLQDIKQKVKNAQIKASVRVNSELILMYWELGEAIAKKQTESNWGDGLITQLSKDLIAEFPYMKGFSTSNLKFIKQWYCFYSQGDIISQQLVSQLPLLISNIDNSRIRQQVVAQLPENSKSQQPVSQIQYELMGLLSQVPWGHHIQIITKCKDIDSALFYVLKTIENSWSRSVLVHQMELNLYKRQGKSINNFEITLPKADSDMAIELLKSSYSLEFLKLSEEAKEKDLQNALLDNMTAFLMELGYGFAFLGKQKLLSVGGDDFYVDLVFYHTKLHCYFIVELKIDNFKPEYAGKLNFYLNAFNAQIKSSDDNPTIGLLLCKKANKLVAEYSLKNMINPMGISEYRLMEELPKDMRKALPSIEEIEKELKNYKFVRRKI
ncbi:MAG: PDDEXK nuclease domain-containing protein [bacterium]